MIDSAASSMKLLIVTDTWKPQINGVVRTLASIREYLDEFGYQVTMITPDRFYTIPHPGSPDIRLAINVWPKLGGMINELRPNYIFVVTEGPLGIAARCYCASRGLHFTSSFTTNFPGYFRLRVGIPELWTYAWLRWFHSPSSAVLVSTESLREKLLQRKFKNIRSWSRGVDTRLFRPREELFFVGLRRPIWLFVGRVAVEKNLDAFLGMSLDGTKVVVGSGPAFKTLRRRYPEACFVGEQHGESLARCYADSDVFVFPSKTDTFGIVMIEALASGIPVAAYPVMGPKDVIASSKVGVLHTDLKKAALGALSLKRSDCRKYALRFTWEECAERLHKSLVRNAWN